MVETIMPPLVGLISLAKDSHYGKIMGLEYLSTPHMRTNVLGKVGESLMPPQQAILSFFSPWFTQSMGELGLVKIKTPWLSPSESKDESCQLWAQLITAQVRLV